MKCLQSLAKPFFFFSQQQLMYQISSNPGAGRKVFFFNCGIHAREWVTPATCMIILKQVC